MEVFLTASTQAMRRRINTLILLKRSSTKTLNEENISAISTISSKMFYYDGDLYLIGGKNEKGSYHDLYISENHGINWKLAESKVQLKAIEEGLVNAQIVTDEKYIRVFGGNEGSNKKVWQAHLNRMLFEKK